MAEPTLPPSDVHNQPADQKLINDHPELLDRSLEGQVPGPQPTGQAPAAPAVGPAAPEPIPGSERVAVPSQVPAGQPSVGTDSTGHPRPHGQKGSAQERTQVQTARQHEAQERARMAQPSRAVHTPPSKGRSRR